MRQGGGKRAPQLTQQHSQVRRTAEMLPGLVEVTQRRRQVRDQRGLCARKPTNSSTRPVSTQRSTSQRTGTQQSVERAAARDQDRDTTVINPSRNASAKQVRPRKQRTSGTWAEPNSDPHNTIEGQGRTTVRSRSPRSRGRISLVVFCTRQHKTDKR